MTTKITASVTWVRYIAKIKTVYRTMNFDLGRAQILSKIKAAINITKLIAGGTNQ